MERLWRGCRALWRRATIKVRVAVLAALLASVALLGLGYFHLQALSGSFTRLANTQGLTTATQLSTATRGAGPGIVDVIPFSPDGLDAVAIFDSRGRVVTAGGGMRATARSLRRQARLVIRRDRPLQLFTSGGRLSSRLTPGSPLDTAEATVVPHGKGALVAVSHVRWATAQLHAQSRGFTLSLLGGVLFIGFGLMLLLNRLVTQPLGRLASEVRHLGEGNLTAPLSAQEAPELEQLAADIAAMRDDLIEAMRASNTDPLTGVANHRAFHERLEQAIGAASRAAVPVSLIALDLDNLKTINDRFGHLAGDRILEAVAGAIASVCREGDLCARVGGDEFSIICHGADASAAAAIGRRILHAVGHISPQVVLGRASAPHGLQVSISLGVCDLPARAETKDDLVARADAALYQAKAAGRGRVGIYEGAENGARAQAAQDGLGDRRLSATVRALAMAVDAKDSGTRSHCETVAYLARLVAERIGMEPAEIESVARAALLHDVGKIGTPDAILMKPGPLTLDERRVMCDHPVLGHRIMLSGGLPEREAVWVLHHHEHWDGGGYPDGLRAADIPLQSRILLAVDAFEAMTSDRPYRAARPVVEAMAEMRRCAGTQFDPEIVEVLAQVIEAEGALATLPELAPSPIAVGRGLA